MAIVQFPAWRYGGDSDRAALRGGVATSRPFMKVVRVDNVEFCDRCAAPIEFGAVVRGDRSYCSVECSLGGSVG